MKLTTDLIQLKVFVDDKSIQEYHKDSKTFVEGREGSKFALVIKNLTGRRLLVHPTVDGLSAMTGEEASKTDKRGYILDPYAIVNVPGWRLDDESVAHFFFAGAGESYAEKTDKELNKGVIAAAVWEEVYKLITYWPYDFNDCWSQLDKRSFGYDANRADNNSFGWSGSHTGSLSYSASYSASCPEQTLYECNNLGTGFGERTQHHVRRAEFEASTVEPIGTAVIYYDNLEGLRARGIKIRSKKKSNGLPNPFPKDKGCTPPADWQG